MSTSVNLLPLFKVLDYDNDDNDDDDNDDDDDDVR